MSTPTSLRPRQLAFAVLCVALGGAAGTLLRYLLLLTDPVPPSHGATQADWFRAFPWVLTGINVVGVYLVTLLLAGRFRHLDPNSTARVGVVTGFFGGFTSYSSLYVDLGALCRASLVGGTMAILVTAVTGLGAVWLGLRSAR